MAKAQTFIPIPDTISGEVIDLNIQAGSAEFYPGYATNTIGYNGNHLGKTIMLNKGQTVTLNVQNQLADTSTTHWHGLHVSPMNDGSPHNLIMSGDTWSPNFTVMDKAATYWYHPHLHGKTMEQVLMGAAGLIIVRDDEEATLNLPRTYGVDDFPLILQWKTINATTKQFVMDDELDNTTMVNGTINGQLNVPAQMVRFRVLNGSSHRYFYFAMNDNRNFDVIAGDESLLNTPVTVNKLLISPGERYEVVIDFSGQSGNTYFLKQLGTQLPAGYPGGPPDQMGMGTPGPLDDTDFNLLQFNVIPATSNPVTSLPTVLTTNTPTSTVGAGTRTFNMQGSPMMSMTNFTINGTQYNHEVINFTTKQDSVMVWSLTNQSMMPHPWHIHGNYFYITSLNGTTPPAHMQGRKDVVTVPPMGGTVQLVMKYEDFSDPMMPYMYHCHILSHEDSGMMGQFIVSPDVVSATHGVEGLKAVVQILPNPAVSFFQVQATLPSSEPVEMHIFDALGRQMEARSIGAVAAIDLTVDCSTWNTGAYFVKITQNGRFITTEFVKH